MNRLIDNMIDSEQQALETMGADNALFAVQQHARAEARRNLFVDQDLLRQGAIRKVEPLDAFGIEVVEHTDPWEGKNLAAKVTISGLVQYEAFPCGHDANGQRLQERHFKRQHSALGDYPNTDAQTGRNLPDMVRVNETTGEIQKARFILGEQKEMIWVAGEKDQPGQLIYLENGRPLPGVATVRQPDGNLNIVQDGMPLETKAAFADLTDKVTVSALSLADVKSHLVQVRAPAVKPAPIKRLGGPAL